MARFGSMLAIAVILIISFQQGILLTVHIFLFSDIQTGYCSSNFGDSLFLISFAVFANLFPFSIINIRFNSIYEAIALKCWSCNSVEPTCDFKFDQENVPQELLVDCPRGPKGGDPVCVKIIRKLRL